MRTSSSTSIDVLKSGDVVWLSVACGFAVATLYYNQPILLLIGTSFGRSYSDVGWIATLTQIGYASGLLFIGPLGDKIDRGKLITWLLLVNIFSLVLCAMSSNFVGFLAASCFVGLTSITAQIIIPAVSGLVAKNKQGKTIGSLMSGLFAGILLARTLSGFVGQYAGWRSMFYLAAIMDLVPLFLIWIKLPVTIPSSALTYLQLLRSLWELMRRESQLREVCITGFMLFAAFNALWGALAFLLAQKPYYYGSNITGLFGLIGLVGILFSPFIGSLADRYGGRVVVGLGALFVMIAFGFIAGANINLWLLIVGVVLLDLGSRAGLVANQARLYPISPDSRSRLNTLFMSSYFSGGAVGSMLGAMASSRYGWYGVSLVGAGCAIAALLLIIFKRHFDL